MKMIRMLQIQLIKLMNKIFRVQYILALRNQIQRNCKSWHSHPNKLNQLRNHLHVKYLTSNCPISIPIHIFQFLILIKVEQFSNPKLLLKYNNLAMLFFVFVLHYNWMSLSISHLGQELQFIILINSHLLKVLKMQLMPNIYSSILLLMLHNLNNLL